MTNKHVRWFVYSLLISSAGICAFSESVNFDPVPFFATMAWGYAIVTFLITLDFAFDVVSRKSLGSGHVAQLNAMCEYGRGK